MESALISIVSVALVIISSVTMMFSSFGSINSMMDSWMAMENESDEIRRTDISLVPAPNYSGGTITLYIENEGDTNISSFDDWDVIAKYETGVSNYIDYTGNPSPGANEWSLEGIYLSDNTSVEEIFDHDILNPGESAKLILNLDPELEPGEYGMIVASTEKGVTSQCFINRQ